MLLMSYIFLWLFNFLFLDRIGVLVHLLNQLLHTHLCLFAWVFNRRYHFFDLNDGWLYWFALPFVKLPPKNIKGFSQLLHCLSVTLFKLKNLFDDCWKLRKLISMLLVYQPYKVVLYFVHGLILIWTVFFSSFY